MSYLPYCFDFERHNRNPMRFAMPFMPEAMFDDSTLDYFPKLSRCAGVRKPSKDRFEVYLDVEDYSPEDLRVKTIEGFVVVEGRHAEKRDDHGWVKRQFTRRCPLPEGYTTKALLSQYSSDGTLTITASLVKSDEGKGEKLTKKTENDEEVSDSDNSESDSGESDSSKKPPKPKPAKPKPVNGDDVYSEDEADEKQRYLMDEDVAAILKEFNIKE